MERIYVTVRARPLSPEDSKSSPWRISGNSISLAGQSNSKFDFDRIFGEDCKTDDVYEARTKEIVASAVRGFNGTVFAYGQTNSGKTHTMRGSVAEPGIIPLAVYDLFQSIQEDMDREFLVRMSYMEIYNEEINDLLVPEHRRLQIHESHERGIYVAGLREEIVTSPEQVIDFMEFGESHRHIGETNMNLYSSRSHTIFRMIIESRERTRDGDDNNSCEAVRVSVLNLVDLAGSERAAKTGAEGLRLKEGSHINKSLMTLGTVIKKLSEGADIQGGHVPYRDSKLTRILQPALGGNANTAIICNITLAQVHVDETKSSLQFASRALCVTNCACVNEILTDAALLKRQRKEIEELRGKLLASHSEHWEEEILNLRNTLLQSELEKERIALELEEEKRAKAQRERRLIEQAKKIENLSSLVLCSERDEKSSFISKNKRRVTWCPGPLTQKLVNEVSSPDQGAAIKMSNKDGRGVGLPPPFEELIQSSGVSGEDYHSHSYLPDGHYADKLDFPLPDAHALLHITRRRKIHSKGVCLLESDQTTENHVGFEDQTMKSQFQTEAMEVETGCLTNKSMEIEYTPCRASTSVCEQSESASCENKGFGSRESEAVLVIKQLQDQIRSLELEKNSIQSEFESAVKLVADQNGSFRDNYEEVLRLDSSSKLSMQIEGVALEFDHLRETIGNISSTMECFSQNFPALLEMLLELKSFACQDMEQFKFIISSHNKMHGFLKQKIEELQLEKSLSHDQSIDHHQQIEKLEADLVDQEKASADRIFQYELEKDDLLSQILNLQKEVSCLSTSSLAREKETLRKELDKTKVKLRDTEAKFKSTIQEKIKLESEKAQAEREIKHLHSQKAILERDIWKRDSIIDKQRELKFGDLNKPKGSTLINEQTLKDEYQKLEILACEMEAEIASLKEAWVAAKEEKQEAVCRIEILGSELEAMAYKLKSTNSEMELLQEEIASMKKKLDESESLSKKFEASLQSLSREKEEMAMQLTDALLEMEAEKSSWSIKERAYSESNERLKMPDDEIVKLSKELLEVRIQLDSCREQCSVLTEKLSLSERTEQEEHSMTLSSGILDLRNEMGQYLSDRVECAELRSNFEKLSSEYHYACGEINYLKDKLSILARERDLLSLKLKEMDARSKFSDDYQNLERQCLVISRERDDLLSRTLDLETALAEAEGTRKNYDDMLLEARRNMMESTTKLSTLESRMHEKGVKNNKENTKLKMQLRWTQAKLDMFRQRYQEAENEKGLMNRKFEEAASKLKEQLGSYGVEILRLKKQLATKQ